MSKREIDEAKVGAFMERTMGDFKGAMVLLMANIGDSLGLFSALAEASLTSEELAERAGVQERYAREWLCAMACAGYLEHDPATERFSLPPEHAEVLARPDSPMFLGGVFQEVPSLYAVLPSVRRAFVNGGGLRLGDYDGDWWDGMARFTSTWFENFLLQEWIPKADGVQSKLEQGARVADVGCGAGRALIKLAERFPQIEGVGYDLSPSNLETARRAAEQAGVADRLTFEERDVTQGIPERFDFVTTFDAVHDMTDPDAAFSSIHDALEPGGAYLLLEFRVGDSLEDNLGPIGAMFYSLSVMYCMTTSLGHGGAGIGTCGLPESAVRDKAARAGFSSVAVVPFDNPLNVVYLARK